MVVNMHEAKTHLSKLVERVEAGEEIIIGRHGRPVARLVAYEADPRKRVPGRMKGRIWASDDFDETSEDLIEVFEGRV